MVQETKKEPTKEQKVAREQKPVEEYVNPHDEKPIIKEEDIEESKEQPEN